MREILFRGQDADSNEWRYGYYIKRNDGDRGALILEDYYLESYEIVKPETVGQYTGVRDKNGTKIFEGDICWFYGGDYYSGLWEQNAIVAITDMTDDEQTHYLNNAEYCEVIGNIYDNPELLEGDKT